MDVTNQSGIKKVAIGAILAGTLSLTSLLGSVASADTPPVSEVVVTKLTDSTAPSAAGDFDNDADVDGRDFLAWQRSSSPAASGIDYQHIDLYKNIWINQ
jgi:hypothetical protein